MKTHVLAVLAFALCMAVAEASHARGFTCNWRDVAPSSTTPATHTPVQMQCTSHWESDATSIGPGSFGITATGHGSFGVINFSTNPGLEIVAAQFVDVHGETVQTFEYDRTLDLPRNDAMNNPLVVDFNYGTCCRSNEISNGSGSMDMHAVYDRRDTESVSVTSPVYLSVPVNQPTWSTVLPVAHSNQLLDWTCNLTPVARSGLATQPAIGANAFTVTTVGTAPNKQCVLSWDTTGGVPETLYGVSIEVHHPAPSQTRVVSDFVIALVDGPPTCTIDVDGSPVSNGDSITMQIGTSYTFSFTGHHDVGSLLTGSGTTDGLGTVSPSSGNAPVTGSFTHTPAAGDASNVYNLNWRWNAGTELGEQCALTALVCDDTDGDGICNDSDCNPNDPTVFPGAPELCDGLDNDCDGVFDEDVSCDDGVACTNDSCAGIAGCLNIPDDSACDDGIACTSNACDATSGCQFTPDHLACDDNISCTADQCDQNNGCQNIAVHTQCSDGIGCTLDTCDTSLGCVNDPVDSACNDNVDCTDDTCDATAGCLNDPDDANCDDGVDCTDDSCDATAGCQFTPVNSNCDDGVACTDDSCDATAGCQYTPVNSNCNDGVSCTDDSCDAIAGCLNDPVDSNCDDGVDCTLDSCDSLAGCQVTPIDSACNDYFNCTTDICDRLTGCQYTTDNSLCDDGNVCTDNTCVVGAGCVFPANTESCDDGNACTLGDFCQNSVCQTGPLPLVCDDINVCTNDTCDPASGCVNTPLPGTNCATETVPCDTDICNAVGQCIHTDLDEDDDNICNDVDLCWAINDPSYPPTFGSPQSDGEPNVPRDGTLHNKRWALIDGDDVFDTVGAPAGGRSFTLADTAGCSCEQILLANGFSPANGLYDKGCSNGIMDNWVASVSQA